MGAAYRTAPSVLCGGSGRHLHGSRILLGRDIINSVVDKLAKAMPIYHDLICVGGFDWHWMFEIVAPFYTMVYWG